MRQALLPSARNELRDFMERVDVRGEGERHDIGLEPVDHAAGLFTGTSVGLFYNDRVAGLDFPVRSKSRVELGVKFARRIVGDVEELDIFSRRPRPPKNNEQREDEMA